MTWDQPAVHVHSHYPGHRLATLAADNVQCSFKRMDPGDASVTISKYDPQASIDLLSKGNLLVIESPDYPPWVGPMDKPQEDSSSGLITLPALGRTAMFDGRNTQQEQVHNISTASGQVFIQLVRNANRIYHTGISLPAIVPSGPSVKDFPVGGQTTLEGLNELHTRTDWEWWGADAVTPSRIDSVVRWGVSEGMDYSSQVHLYEGYHFSEFVYGLDLGAIKAQVTGIGGVVAVADRSSATQSSTIGRNAGPGFLADERIRRAVLSYGMPYTERVFLDLTTRDPAELGRRVKRETARSLASGEQFQIAVNRNADWRKLWKGNFITVHARTTLGGDLARVVRIVNASPSWMTGVTNLDLEVAFQ